MVLDKERVDFYFICHIRLLPLGPNPVGHEIQSPQNTTIPEMKQRQTPSVGNQKHEPVFSGSSGRQTYDRVIIQALAAFRTHRSNCVPYVAPFCTVAETVLRINDQFLTVYKRIISVIEKTWTFRSVRHQTPTDTLWTIDGYVAHDDHRVSAYGTTWRYATTEKQQIPIH